MSIVSRLFKKTRQRSRLEEFLSELTPSAIRSASLKARDEEMRVASAISLLVLAATHRFSSELADSVEKLSVKSGVRPARMAFDVVAFEVAAFSHHALLTPFVEYSDDVNQDESEDDPYFVVLRSAAHLSSSVLQGFTDLGFINRALSYSLPKRRSDAVTEFETILSSAIEGGSPKAGLRGPLSLDLGLTLALRIAIPGFCTNIVPALSVAARNVFENADELGLAD